VTGRDLDRKNPKRIFLGEKSCWEIFPKADLFPKACLSQEGQILLGSYWSRE